MLIPKWLNKWLTPEEEERLQDPGRRVFTFGMLASVACLNVAQPQAPMQLLGTVQTSSPLIVAHELPDKIVTQITMDMKARVPVLADVSISVDGRNWTVLKMALAPGQTTTAFCQLFLPPGASLRVQASKEVRVKMFGRVQNGFFHDVFNAEVNPRLR